MDVKISKHANVRALERGITMAGIMAIVDGQVFTATKPSGIDFDVDIVLGIYEEKIWAVLLNIETKNVVTVRRARKDEEIYYDKKKRERAN